MTVNCLVTVTPNGFKHMLPADFTPGEFDVVIGRGKALKALPGNKHLEKCIRSIADDYAAADKARKSYLLSQLVKQVYAKSPAAGFVKKDPVSGRYYAVEEALSRTTCCQAMRDCLHNHYKSSRQFKQQRRRAARERANASSPADSGLPDLTRQVTPEPSFYKDPYSPCVTASAAAAPKDLFSILAGAFANKPVDPQEDPFAPVPLPEQGSLLREISDSISSVLQHTDLFEPLPIQSLNFDDIFA